jgi:molybdenum cofactor cytidylyltransferase
VTGAGAVSIGAVSIGAVILAAGSSSRMGSPKQILRFRGESLLRRAARAALDAGCSPVIVVTGANAELSRRELDGLDVREVLNPRWETGMASSIAAGLEGLLGVDADAAAAVFLLCDQPHVTSGVISGLAAAHRVTGMPVIASTYGGSFGVPALFGRPLFAELARLEGGAGAKQVIERYASEACFLPFEGGEVDVDTRDDFSRLIATDVEQIGG